MPETASETPSRSPWVAFFVLGLTTASHTLAETARDAVFLASVPATRLPWMYAAVGLAALIALRGLRELDGRFRPGVIFALTAMSGAAVYGVLFLALAAGDELWQLVLMYVFSSVLGSVLVVQFWSITASSLDLRTAKKQFAFIGAGSVAGAIAGSSAAAGLAMVVPARALLLAAAVGFIGASVLGLIGLGTGEVQSTESPPSLRDGLAAMKVHPYPRYIAAIVVLAAMVFILSDYVFKATVAERVSADALAPTFALIYLGLNVGSLAVQLLLVGPIVNRMALNRASAVTPLLAGLAAIGVAASSSLGAAIGLRAVDGLFKHTLHRTSIELLYVPMRQSVRPAVKRLIDVAGHRGGQVVASAGVLVVVWLGGSTLVLAVALGIVAAAWVAVTWAMREPYLDLFRDSLANGRVVDASVTELDLASVEALVTALNSEHAATVRVAIELLFEQGKGTLVPALILHHPDTEVIGVAARLFAANGRVDALPVIQAAMERHRDPVVLSALMRARVHLAPDVQLSRRIFANDQPGARAVAAADLLANPGIAAEERADVARVALTYQAPCHLELLRTVSVRNDQITMTDALREVLTTLSEQPAPVGSAALDAIGATRDTACTGIVIRALGRRDVVSSARRVLATFADDAVPLCAERLADGQTDNTVRLELPRAMADMGPLAVPALHQQLVSEPSGFIAYRVLMALERAVAQWPKMRVRPGQVEGLVQQYVSKADTYAAYRVAIRSAVEQEPRYATRAHPLLERILAEKTLHALQRAVRTYGLTTRREDFRSISAGLGSGDARQVASSLELLEATVSRRFRLLSQAASRHTGSESVSASGLDYEAILDAMGQDSSATVRELASAQRRLIAAQEVA